MSRSPLLYRRRSAHLARSVVYLARVDDENKATSGVSAMQKDRRYSINIPLLVLSLLHGQWLVVVHKWSALVKHDGGGDSG